MATVDDVEVANASFPNVRQDLNDILEAITTNFSADTEPTTTYPNQFWYETDTNLLYIRNEADDAWITLASINQTTGEWEPRTAVIQAIDSAGIALKTDDGTTRFSISDAGVVSFENYAFPSADGTAGQVISTDGSGTLTFEDAGAGDKIEEGNSSVEVVDTGTGHVAVTVDGSETARFDANGRLGIGTSSPTTLLQTATDSFSEADIAQLRQRVITGGLRIGRLSARGYTTGTTEVVGGAIEFLGGGGWSSTSAPTSITFNTTASGSTTVTKQMELDRDGNLQFNSGFGSVATAYGVRAWVNFNGTGTVSIREDGNVSSITDNGTGDYTVNFTNAMPDANYSAISNGGNSGAGASKGFTQDFTTSGYRQRYRDNSGNNVDQSECASAVFR